MSNFLKGFARYIIYRNTFNGISTSRKMIKRGMKRIKESRKKEKPIVQDVTPMQYWTIQEKMARININEEKAETEKLKQEKLKADIELVLARARAVEKQTGQPNQDFGSINIPKDAMGCASCNFIDISGKERFCHTCGKPLSRVNYS